MMAVIDYVCSIGRHFTPDQDDRRALFVEGMNRIHLQERALLFRLLEGTDHTPGLRHIPGVRVYTDMEDLTKKDLIVAMSIDGIGLVELADEYMHRGVTVFERLRSSQYSERIIRTLEIEEGAIRVSPLHCHGKKDIDDFLIITRAIAKAAGN